MNPGILVRATGVLRLLVGLRVPIPVPFLEPGNKISNLDPPGEGMG